MKIKNIINFLEKRFEEIFNEIDEVENNQEIGRILGFFSEYQFWSLMEDLKEKLVKTGS